MNNLVNRIVLTGIILTSVVLGNGNIALAQATSEPMSPQEAQAMMQQMFPNMIRMMYGTVLEIIADPETAEMEAAHARNLYNALLKEGFSEDEALSIVIGYGNPLQGQSSN